MAAAGPSLAQDAIRIGASVSGTLDDSDATGPDGEYRYDDYRITARAGQRLEVTMQSEAFDTYLAVYDSAADDEELFGDDDSFGQDTNSRLRFTATRDGDYLLRARTLYGLDGGDYTLTLGERPAAARAPRPTAIRVGQSRTGELTSGDPETDDAHTYDAYSFRARTGDRIGISLNSSAFDPVVQVGTMDGNTFTQLDQNDDGPGTGLNAYLVFTAPANGTYVTRVTSWSTNGAGAYELGLAEVAAVSRGEPLAIGASVDGDLAETDGRNDAGLTVDGYRFTGRSGQRIEATMSSTVFDAYLELFSIDAASGALTRLGGNDDGGEGTDSRLVYTLPADGEYRLEARGYSADSVGAYALTLAEVEPEPAPEALAFGVTVEGEIDDEDPLDSDGRAFDAYSFGGSEGQRVQVIMRSGDFDTYLEIGAAEGEFSAVAQDDDGLGQGTDSRLNFTLPETGDYVLRARPYAPDSQGLYSIELIDRGPEPVAGSILIGATARGTLTDSDATADDGSYFDAYAVQVKDGDKLVITMVSNAFDAYLVLGREQDGDRFEGLASDDDGLSDTHAKLEWTAPAAGTYVIRAGSYGQGQTGDYAMTVDRQPEGR